MLYLSNLERNSFRIAGALKLHFFGFSVLTIHELLKCKLYGYGIDGKTLKCIDSFLCHRQQRLLVYGFKSDWVPFCQVSVTAPFLDHCIIEALYINVITEDIDSELISFADDCVCYREIKGWVFWV